MRCDYETMFCIYAPAFAPGNMKRNKKLFFFIKFACNSVCSSVGRASDS